MSKQLIIRTDKEEILLPLPYPHEKYREEKIMAINKTASGDICIHDSGKKITTVTIELADLTKEEKTSLLEFFHESIAKNKKFSVEYLSNKWEEMTFQNKYLEFEKNNNNYWHVKINLQTENEF